LRALQRFGEHDVVSGTATNLWWLVTWAAGSFIRLSELGWSGCAVETGDHGAHLDRRRAGHAEPAHHRHRADAGRAGVGNLAGRSQRSGHDRRAHWWLVRDRVLHGRRPGP
jgi:hypothetical protein